MKRKRVSEQINFRPRQGPLVGLFFLLLVTPVWAQYRFDHWTADNGLPQNSVRDIIQTRDGYLWLSTFDGLVRFDGVRFTTFNKSNSPGILNNRFDQLYEDGFGDLWASTEDSGITRLHQGRFTTYTTANGLPGNTVGTIGGDGQGNLIVIYAQLIYRWIEPKFIPASEDQSSAVGGAAKPHWDDAKRLPCFSKFHNEVTFFIDRQERTWQLPQQGKAHFNSVTPMRDRQGDIWFYSRDKGLIRIDSKNSIRIFDRQDGLLGNKSVLVYGQFPLKIFSLGQNNSLWITDWDSHSSQLVASQMPEGFENLADVFVAFADREGNYWIGTAHNGLYRLRRQSVLAYSKAQGLIGTEVYPIFEAADGSIWVGTAAKGLFQFKNQIFKNIATGTEQFGNTATSLLQDRDGNLWIGGIDKVSRLIDGRVETVDQKIADPVLRTYWTIYEDSDGVFWFGAMEGVVRYDHGATTRFTVKDGLAGNDTKVIIPDQSGGLWLGSYGGLTHYQNGQFKAWTDRDGLPSNTVRSLYQDRDGVLWVGTYDGGLGRFKNGHFTRYAVADGLFDNGVFQILEDDYGWFWMSCNRGIFRVQKKALNDFAEGKRKAIQSIAYGKSDGMLNVECNGGRWPAGIKSRDGKLWFPTMDGVAVIDPATVNANPQPPPLVIEGMKIDYQSIPIEQWDSIIRNPQSIVRIEPGQENFEIEYTALSFINSENLRFKYKLEGLDQEWVDTGTRRTAYFSHVPPGDYTFKVIAANSDGIWNEEGRSLRIVVLPPFYRTWWFLTLCALAIIGTVLAIFQYRVTQLEKKQAAQQEFSRQLIESQEGERKRIAAELHDSLGQNLLIIKNRAMLNAMTSSDPQMQTQFNEFSTAVSQTIEEVRTISHDLRPAHLDQLGLRIALVAMIEKVDASSPIEFTHEIDNLDGVLKPGDDINLYRIVQECINNILKHSGATAVIVKVAVHPGVLTLTIHDDGQGFAMSENQRGGLGLQSITERVRILGGTHTIRSAPGQGTTTTVRIELKDQQP